MPTELVFQAYTINQIIGKYICPGYYVTWHPHTSTWIYNYTSWKCMWLYFIPVLINIFNTILFLFIVTFKNTIFSDHNNIEISTKQLVICGFLSLITVISLIPEWLFIASGREWVYAINWVCKAEQITKRYGMVNIKTFKISSGKVLKSLISGCFKLSLKFLSCYFQSKTNLI